MNGTKWYKLNKSNEPLQVFLEGQFSELKTDISDKISTAIVSVGEIILSAVLTILLEKEVDPLNFIWDFFGLFKEDSLSFLKTIISCAAIFLLFVTIGHLIVFLIKILKKCCHNNKKTPKEAYKLQKYFYKQILNDIVTGISLEKKAGELLNNKRSSFSEEQKKNLVYIYLIESVFYFNEAIHNIDDKKIFEINDKKRQEYTDFLESMDSDAICSILKICISTLDRIIKLLEDSQHTSKSAEDAKINFNNYIDIVTRQVKNGN